MKNRDHTRDAATNERQRPKESLVINPERGRNSQECDVWQFITKMCHLGAYVQDTTDLSALHDYLFT